MAILWQTVSAWRCACHLG